MIRRRSVELGRLFEGGAGAPKRNTGEEPNLFVFHAFLSHEALAYDVA